MEIQRSYRFLFMGPFRGDAWDGPVPASGDIEYVVNFPHLRAAVDQSVRDDLFVTLFNRFRPLSGGTGAKGDPVILGPSIYFGHIEHKADILQDPDKTATGAQMDAWGTSVIVRVRGDEQDYFNPQRGSSVYDSDGRLIFRRTQSGKDITWDHTGARAVRHLLGAAPALR